MNIDIKRLQVCLNEEFKGRYKILVKVDKSDLKTNFLNILVNYDVNQNPIIVERDFYCGKIYVTMHFYPKTDKTYLTELDSFKGTLFESIDEFLKGPTTECLNGFRLKIQEILSEIEDLDKNQEIPEEYKEVDDSYGDVWRLRGAALHLKKIKEHLDEIIDQSDLVED
jgi:hypothetical protein